MKKFRSILILIFFIFYLFQNTSYSQKADVEKLYHLVIDYKYEEAYRLAHSKSFKYKEEYADEYFLLHATTCKFLYKANPEINSTFRNEGIHFASRLLSSNDSVHLRHSADIVNYLTTTIYNDVVENIFLKSISDSVKLRDFTTETIEAFEFFKVPNDISDSTLYLIGSSFYNDGVFIMTEMINYDDDVEIITDRADRTLALFNVAALFFKSLCGNYNLHCDTYKMILGALGKTE